MALYLRHLLPILTVASSIAAFSQTTIRVPADQPTIQAGINAAHDGDMVLVAPGVYNENIDFNGKNVTVTSGATSSAGSANTVIQAPASQAAVTFQSGETSAILNGFTITHAVTGGTTVAGDGVAIAYASPMITNNTVVGNLGCGISAAYASSLLLQGNEVTGQQIISVPTSYYCGPSQYKNQNKILADSVTITGAGNVRLTGNYIHENLGQNAHAILVQSSANVSLMDNVIQDNPGGGDQVEIEDVPIVSAIQNLITGTVGVGAFAILNGSNASAPYETKSIVITNNTFTTTGTSAGGILAVADYADISNNIFVDSGSVRGFSWAPFECSLEPSGSTLIFSHNDAYSSGNGISEICASPGQNIGNISADPQFLSISNNNFHVNPASPVVAAGDITAPQIRSADLDTKAREVCGTIDMGVYEVRPHPPVSIVGNPNPAIGGSNVTFTVKVQGNCNVPTGQVSVFDGSNLIATLTLDASGSASFSTSLLTVGNHNLTVTYPGDFNFEASTSPVYVEVILGDPSTTTLQVTPNPAQALQPITFSASVTSPVGTPSGTVTFYAGSNALATVALNASGEASAIISSLGAGTYTITAVYNATTQFISSTSATLTLVVNGAVTSTTLSSTPNPSSFGQTVTFTAVVSAPQSTAIPAGTITFTDGQTTLGTVKLSATGNAQLTVSSLAVGTHPITALYSGSTNDNPSTSNTVSQIVTADATGTSLTATPNPAIFTQSVTLTATVAVQLSGAPQAAGTVVFSDQFGVIAISPTQNGVATATTSTLSLGSHNIVATFNGSNGTSTSISNTVVEVIQPFDFSLALSPTTLTIPSGDYQILTVSLTPIGLFNHTVTLSCSSLPAYAQCVFQPGASAALANGAQSLKLVVNTSQLFEFGNQAQLTKGGRSAETGVSLALIGMFWVPAFIVFRNGSATMKNRTRRISLCLFAMMGVSLLFGLQGCGSGKLPESTPPGSYVITVIGTDASSTIVHSQVITLVVR